MPKQPGALFDREHLETLAKLNKPLGEQLFERTVPTVIPESIEHVVRQVYDIPAVVSETAVEKALVAVVEDCYQQMTKKVGVLVAKDTFDPTPLSPFLPFASIYARIDRKSFNLVSLLKHALLNNLNRVSALYLTQVDYDALGKFWDTILVCADLINEQLFVAAHERAKLAQILKPQQTSVSGVVIASDRSVCPDKDSIVTYQANIPPEKRAPDLPFARKKTTKSPAHTTVQLPQLPPEALDKMPTKVWVAKPAVRKEAPAYIPAPPMPSVKPTAQSGAELVTIIPTWAKVATPCIGMVGMAIGLAISGATTTAQPQRFRPSMPSVTANGSVQSNLASPSSAPTRPDFVVTGTIPPLQQVPVVPFTVGVAPSVNSAIRRVLIVNHVRTLLCVPASAVDRAKAFRYFVDGVTHFAANRSPLMRSWRFGGDAARYTSTLDTISSDCRTFRFTLYRDGAVEVASSDVTIPQSASDLIAARQASGREPTPLPTSVHIDFTE